MVKPVLFNKADLETPDFKPFLYDLRFQGGTKRDLKAEGYLKAAYPHLVGIESTLLHYGKAGGSDQPGARSSIRAVVKVAVRMGYTDTDGKYREDVFEAFGDGDEREVADTSALVRETETRALKRALARALGIGKVDLNSDGDIDEEEVGTRIRRPRLFPNRDSESATEPGGSVRSEMEAEGRPVQEDW